MGTLAAVGEGRMVDEAALVEALRRGDRDALSMRTAPG
jgi:lactate dehydrogenase-like 2-hydroxyacid dehydrogenase